MTLQLRRLRLRASTSEGVYGVIIPFRNGLTAIWADNTKGKSTCTQGMLYALGLERMLSPRREVPLPHAMTHHLNTDDGRTLPVLASDVALEVENKNGQIITIHRAVKATTDNRLVRVEFGPTLSAPATHANIREFFTFDSGAASRELGFHWFLEDFMDWRLPTVRRYDATDTKLYLETIFPLFWVEQKMGWSTIPAAIPTYLRIRDVQKRAVEFLMDLDAYKNELRLQQIGDLIAANSREWRVEKEKLENAANQLGCKVESIPKNPSAIPDDLARAQLVVEHEGWKPVRSVVQELRSRVAAILSASIPDVATASESLALELQRLLSEIEKLNRDRLQLYGAKQLKRADVDSLQRRVTSLEEDLQKNIDVQKLQRYSGASTELTPDRCPTCEQSLSDTLLSQEIVNAVMPIEENIEYIRSQLRMFRHIVERETVSYQDIERDLAKMDRELSELYGRVRYVRTDLVSPGAVPSAVAIEERVRAENRMSELESLEATFHAGVERLTALALTYEGLLSEKAALPQEMTVDDERKLKTLTALLQEQAKDYGFRTFRAGEVTISSDTYKPQKEGFEIGFETSASDAIRLKWAYQMALLELGARDHTNHPNFLMLDEPRQQSSSKVSFGSLLRRAALAKERNQQVMFFTSEDRQNFFQMTNKLDCYKIVFDGYVLQPLR